MDLISTKIAVLCNYRLLPNRVGGMDYFFWAFDQHCKANGMQVDWYFPNSSSHGEYAKLTIFSADELTIEHYFLANCSAKKYTFIITHFLEICTSFYSKVKKKCDSKIIAVDHNPRPIDGYSLLKRSKKKIKGLLYSRYIDCFVGVSNYTKSELIKDFGKRIASKTIVIYNGVLIDSILQITNRKSIQPKFLVASHLRESKGIQHLIQAVSLLSNAIKNELVIDVYGDGPYKETLLQLIGEKQVANCFNFKGSVSNLHAVYANYDYMLQPTLMECFSLSILESLAANVPVITTNVGGNEEAVHSGENGYIYPVGNYLALKELIESLWMGEKQINSFTREAIEQHFSIEKMVLNHFELLKK
jgi:glycosyltransferase involved in cell wall biosynthesis